MPNPLKADPSRTTTLRGAFVVAMRKRFRALAVAVIKLIEEEDALGVGGRLPNLNTARVDTETGNVYNAEQRWRFLTDAQKLDSFQGWLEKQTKEKILAPDAGTPPGQPWVSKYTTSAYRKGLERTYGEVFKSANAPNLDFYAGGKEQFLRSAFTAPEATSKIKLLATRAYENLKGVTAQMSAKMASVLAGGMVAGKNPRQIARELAQQVEGLGKARALTIARTEIIHAHAEGQLDALEQLGVDEVSALVEWDTAGDDKVCPRCAALAGQVFEIKEARGMLPLHPNCRCAWVPADSTKATPKQKKAPKAPALPPPSKAKVVLKGVNDPDEVLSTFKDFGVRDAQHVATLMGAPDDSVVELRVGFGTLSARFEGPDGAYEARRIFRVDAQGNRYIENDYFFIGKPGLQGQGLGTEVFSKQVASAREAVFSYIATHAAKSANMNGYYTWPRLGYDQPIALLHESTGRAAKKAFPDADTILDIMATPEGRDWWKANGSDLKHARFYLNPNSRSIKILEAYQEEKRAKEKA